MTKQIKYIKYKIYSELSFQTDFIVKGDTLLSTVSKARDIFETWFLNKMKNVKTNMSYELRHNDEIQFTLSLKRGE